MSEIKRLGLEGELYSCAQCGYCHDVCPIYDEIPFESASPRGKFYWIKGILNTGFLRPNVEVDENFVNRLFQCTLCGRCHEVCQTAIDTVKLWKIARVETRLSGFLPKNLRAIVTNLEETRNPYGLEAEMRLDWADYSGLEEAPVKDKAELAYFVGCTTAFKSSNHGTAYSIASILNQSGEDWTLLGEEEWCCGSPLLLSGDEEGAKEYAKHNVEALEEKAVKTVITGCAGCFRVFKLEYPQLLGRRPSFNVVHAVEYLRNKIISGELKPEPFQGRVTYHDPCELSRLGGVIDAPREILKHLANEYVELPEHGMDVRCCGGGGLLQATNGDLRLDIVKRRLEQVSFAGAEVLTSACPACKLAFVDGVRAIDSKIEVLDLMELAARQLGLA